MYFSHFCCQCRYLNDKSLYNTVQSTQIISDVTELTTAKTHIENINTFITKHRAFKSSTIWTFPIFLSQIYYFQNLDPDYGYTHTHTHINKYICINVDRHLE